MPASYSSYPVPQSVNIAHQYGTSGTGRVTIGSGGSISAGGSAPGDLTFGYSTRTITYSSTNTESRPSPNGNINHSQTASQVPFFLMPPLQQQQGGFIQQASYGSSRLASPDEGQNSDHRVMKYASYGSGEDLHDTDRRTGGTWRQKPKDLG